MVTLGLRATSPESQKARQISVMKKIFEERSKIFSQEVLIWRSVKIERIELESNGQRGISGGQERVKIILENP